MWRGRIARAATSFKTVDKSSPVVKEKSYLEPKHDLRQEQGGKPCRGADLRQRRDPQRSGGVVPKLMVAGETGLESVLFSQVPRRVFWKRSFAIQVRPVVKMRVTSPQEREMQVRILPRELCPRS